MSIRNNVLVQYSVATFFVTLAATLTLALVLAGNVSDYYLRSHVATFPQVIALAFQEDGPTAAWFQARVPGEPPPPLKARLDQLLHLGKIFRLKVWLDDGTILWSDEPTLVGQKLESAEMKESRETRRPVYEIGTALTAENIAERGRGTLLQVYTPILQAGQVVGVIELYEDNQELFQQIAGNTQDIWGLVLAFGLLLYLLLFGVFLRAYRNQQRANQELERTQEATVFALAFQAELRDHETGRHLERTARYVDRLAEALGLAPAARRDLVRAAPLHDIGKVGIPDGILLKPGPLTAAERQVMETHCDLGDSVLAAAEEKLPFRSFLTTARELVRSHHEKWNGTGYPRGLAGEAIPLAGRIMALADVYDALRSRRPYKEPRSHEACVIAISELAGTQFDPRIVEAFLEVGEEFRRISEREPDQETQRLA